MLPFLNSLQISLTLVPPTGIEPVPKDFQSSVLTKLHYRGKILGATCWNRTNFKQGCKLLPKPIGQRTLSAIFFPFIAVQGTARSSYTASFSLPPIARLQVVKL